MAQRASSRIMPKLRSEWTSTAASSSDSQKLGQPVPDSYLVSLENNGASHTTQW